MGVLTVKDRAALRAGLAKARGTGGGRRTSLPAAAMILALCGWAALCLGQQGDAPEPKARGLRDAIEAAARELGPACSGGDRVGVLVPDGAGELERYGAAMMAFFLREGGADAHLVPAPAVPAELPERLPVVTLIVWRQADIGAAVLLRLTGRGPDYHLAARAYALKDGAMLAAGGAPVRIGADLSFLLSAQRGELAPQDRQWHAIFARIFPAPVPADENREERMALAEGKHFFERGMWQQAVATLSRAGAGEPDLRLVRIAVALHSAGEADEALEKVEGALKIHPDSGPLYALKAWILLRREAPEDALIFLEQARLTDLPHEGYYWIARHLIALERGEGQTAEQSLLKGVEMLPEVPFALLRAARFYWREARFEEAMRFYRKALDAGAGGAGILVEFGMALEASGQPEQALDAFRRAVETEPGNPAVARHLSSALKSAGHHDEALRVLKQAAETRPDRLELLTAYADMAAEFWHTVKAEKAYAEAFARDPGFLQGRVGLARMLARRRHFTEAQELLQEVLGEASACPGARVVLAETFVGQGHIEEAIEALQEAARDLRSEVAARTALARLYCRAEQHEKAIHEAQLAVAASPGPESYALLARAFTGSRQWENSKIAVEKALEGGPGVPAAHLAAAELDAARGGCEEALAAAEKALELNPRSPRALVLAGEFRLRLDQPQECAELWRRAAALNPWNPELHWDLAELLRTRLGNTQEAIEHYRRHVELDGARSKDAQRLLEQLQGAPEVKGGADAAHGPWEGDRESH